MTDKKLTDKEITKVLERCCLVDPKTIFIRDDRTGEITILNMNDVFDRITRLQAENERLKSCIKTEKEVREIAKRTMEPLVKEITREQIDIAVKYAKAEAYKECIEKVEEKANKCFTSCNGVVLEETTTYNISKISLDEILKELVGDK